MNRTLCTFCTLMFLSLAAIGTAQTTPTIAALYDRLIQPSETNAAAPEILEMAKNDSTAGNFLAGKLPSIIVNQLPNGTRPVSPVWANAVILAGRLKIAEAVPALKQALARPPVQGGFEAKALSSMTFGTESRLGLDIVGRALADIGDPSVPVLVEVLSKGDFGERRRAIWILSNIDSPAARKAMLDHLPNESDSGLSKLIKNLLHI